MQSQQTKESYAKGWVDAYSNLAKEVGSALPKPKHGVDDPYAEEWLAKDAARFHVHLGMKDHSVASKNLAMGLAKESWNGFCDMTYFAECVFPDEVIKALFVFDTKNDPGKARPRTSGKPKRNETRIEATNPEGEFAGCKISLLWLGAPKGWVSHFNNLVHGTWCVSAHILFALQDVQMFIPHGKRVKAGTALFAAAGILYAVNHMDMARSCEDTITPDGVQVYGSELARRAQAGNAIDPEAFGFAPGEAGEFLLDTSSLGGLNRYVFAFWSSPA